MNILLALGVLAVVLPSLYLYTVSVAQARFPNLRNKRICLLIAHPDDEAMFFAPTVLALTRPETGNHVKILCLSSGNADGLGETRKKELVKSGMLLGLRKEDDVFVLDSPDFPDSMKTAWDAGKISSLLTAAFAPNLSKARSSEDVAPTATIDVLITFDEGGVSGHPNHASLYRGAASFVRNLVQGKPGWQSPVDVYALTSVSLPRKYASLLDAPVTLAQWALGANFKNREHPDALAFFSGPAGVATAWGAMREAHKSQMLWFRYGWIGFSRYMVMNDLRLEKIGK